MTRWTTTTYARTCGSCAAAVPAGAPMRSFREPALTPWCADCVLRVLQERPYAVVNLTPPPTVPPLQPLVERVRRQLGLDVKQRAAGDE